MCYCHGVARAGRERLFLFIFRLIVKARPRPAARPRREASRAHTVSRRQSAPEARGVFASH